MKKYIKPILCIETIEIQDMLAVSGGVNNTPKNDFAAGAPNRRSLWDVDWE